MNNDFEWENSNRRLLSDENFQIYENLLKQNKFLNEITNKVNKIISLLTSTLIIHLNIQQDFIINTSQIYFSIKSLQNQNEIFFFRVCFFILFRINFFGMNFLFSQ
jgi:hypothetical protein